MKKPSLLFIVAVGMSGCNGGDGPAESVVDASEATPTSTIASVQSTTFYGTL